MNQQAKPETTDAEKPQSAPRTTGTVAKKTLLWVSGVTPTLMFGREVKNTASVMGWMLRNIIQVVNFNRDQAKDDLNAARENPEEFWDRMVVTAEITESSLRKRYQLATMSAYACFAVLGVAIGIMAAYQGAVAVTVGNAVLINLMLILYINNLHKLYTAREQRIEPVTAFLRKALRDWRLLLPQGLPETYRLRTPRKHRQGSMT